MPRTNQTDTGSVYFSLRVPTEVISEIDKMATETMRSRVGMIRWLLQRATQEWRKGKTAAPGENSAAGERPLCGFCITGDHDMCLGGQTNPDTKEVVVCECGCGR